MSFKLVKSETQALTKEYLDWFLGIEESPLERKIKPSRVEFLRSKAAAQQIVPFHWVTARPSWNGHSLIRMNGHHSSTMLSKLPSLDPNWSVHYDEFEVDKPEDMVLLFRQIDPRESARSAIDVCGTYKGAATEHTPELAKVPTEIVKLGIEGVYWWRNFISKDRKNIKGDDRYALLVNDPESHRYVQWIGKIYSSEETPVPELKRISIAAALFATFEKHEESARSFWEAVAHGGTEDDDPAAVLDTWLQGTLKKDQEVKLKQGNFWNGCVYAWNAFRDGKTIMNIPSSARGYGIEKGFHEVL
jgi:hypothetical protein